MDRQKGNPATFLSPSGQGGYEVVEKGAKSDTSTSKLALRCDSVEEWHDVLGKTKSTFTQACIHNLTPHTFTLVLYIAVVQNWHMGCHLFFPLPFAHTENESPTHTLKKCPAACRHQIFNLPSPRFSQKSHYHHHSGPGEAQWSSPDPPYQASENATPLLARAVLCLFTKTIKEASIQREAKIPFPSLSSHPGQ